MSDTFYSPHAGVAAARARIANSRLATGTANFLTKERSLFGRASREIIEGSSDDLAVLMLRPNRKSVLPSSEALARVRNAEVVTLGNVHLVGSDEVLSIVAHGGKGRGFLQWLTGGRTAGGLSPGRLAHHLKGRGVKPEVIELVVCNAGGGTGAQAFGGCFAQSMANRMGVSVVAAPGRVNVLKGSFGIPQMRDPVTRKLLPINIGFQTFKPESRIIIILRRIIGQ